jgi:quercetin dioxygenase-like cupin family protein
MKLSGFEFAITDWNKAEVSRSDGDTGYAQSRARQVGDVLFRLIEYSPGYAADHWCSKGHIVYCLEGELEIRLKDGRVFRLAPGMSYEVADGVQPHRSSTAIGAKLVIVD